MVIGVAHKASAKKSYNSSSNTRPYRSSYERDVSAGVSGKEVSGPDDGDQASDDQPRAGSFNRSFAVHVSSAKGSNASEESKEHHSCHCLEFSHNFLEAGHEGEQADVVEDVDARVGDFQRYCEDGAEAEDCRYCESDYVRHGI